MAPKRAALAHATTSDVPEGWELVTEFKKNGRVIEYYGNVLDQKFYNKEDLMRYINYAKERGLSIYAPDFLESTSAIPTNKGKKHVSKEVCTTSKKQNEVENENEIDCARALLDISLESQNEVECARALLQISTQSTGNVVSRASRRLAGVEPELSHDFVSNRALEYVLKERPHK